MRRHTRSDSSTPEARKAVALSGSFVCDGYEVLACVIMLIMAAIVVARRM